MSDRCYTGEEGDFVLFALPDLNIGSIDDFIDGKKRTVTRNTKGERVEGDFVVLGAEVVSYLREIRTEAFAAYRAGNIDLMMAKLGQLEAQCNWRGLAFATKSIVDDDYAFRVKQSETNRTNAENRHPIARSGKDERDLFADELVAKIAPSRGVAPKLTKVVMRGLWYELRDLLGDGHEELDPELIEDDKGVVTSIEFNVNIARKRKGDDHKYDDSEPKRGQITLSTFKKYLDKAPIRKKK